MCVCVSYMHTHLGCLHECKACIQYALQLLHLTVQRLCHLLLLLLIPRTRRKMMSQAHKVHTSTHVHCYMMDSKGVAYFLRASASSLAACISISLDTNWMSFRLFSSICFSSASDFMCSSTTYNRWDRDSGRSFCVCHSLLLHSLHLLFTFKLPHLDLLCVLQCSHLKLSLQYFFLKL